MSGCSISCFRKVHYVIYTYMYDIQLYFENRYILSCSLHLFLIDQSLKNCFHGEIGFLYIVMLCTNTSRNLSLNQAIATGVHGGHELCRCITCSSQPSFWPHCSSHKGSCIWNVCFSGLSLPCSTTEAFPIKTGRAESWVQLRTGGPWGVLASSPLPQPLGPGTMPLQELWRECRVCGQGCWFRVGKGTFLQLVAGAG